MEINQVVSTGQKIIDGIKKAAEVIKGIFAFAGKFVSWFKGKGWISEANASKAEQFFKGGGKIAESVENAAEGKVIQAIKVGEEGKSELDKFKKLVTETAQPTVLTA